MHFVVCALIYVRTGAGWFYLGFPGKGILSLASLVLPVCMFTILAIIVNIHFCWWKKGAKTEVVNLSQATESQYFMTKSRYYQKNHVGCWLLFLLLFIIPIMVLASALMQCMIDLVRLYQGNLTPVGEFGCVYRT